MCLHRRGMVQDRTFDDQRLRAGGLNLVPAAIVLWKTVYLEWAVETLRAGGTVVPDELLHLSPLAWEHIILTGEYRWGPTGRANLVNAASYDQHADVPIPSRPSVQNLRKDVVTRSCRPTRCSTRTKAVPPKKRVSPHNALPRRWFQDQLIHIAPAPTFTGLD